MKEKINLEMALAKSGNATDSADPEIENGEQLEINKKPSYLSVEGRFNGEITTPSKIEETEAIQLEEL